MLIQDLLDANLFTLKTLGRAEKPISRIFCCDLLSIAMSKAPMDCVWITVMGNKNTLAVASLANASCIILAENIHFSDADLSCAEKEGITIFETKLPIFDAAWKLCGIGLHP